MDMLCFGIEISKTSFQTRFLWWFVMAAFMAITAFQTTQIFTLYSRNPVTTTAEKKFPRTLQFPRVAICNTMPWRVSTIEPRGKMHFALSKVFQDAEPNMTLLNMPEIRRVFEEVNDTREFLLHVAHQKEDMIVSCKFNNLPCSKKNFTTLLTPSGICYAFNNGRSNPLSTQSAGKDGGLQVTLNIATYEVVNGDFETFGAKVYIYSHDLDLPPISELDANTGAATSFSISERNINLVDNCGSTPLLFFDRYSRDKCMKDFTYFHVYNMCKCWPFVLLQSKLDSVFAIDARTNSASPVVEQYLKRYTNDTVETIRRSRTCNMFEHFTCVNSYLKRPTVVRNSVITTCMDECKQTYYTPVVSSAIVAWDQIQTSFTEKLDNIYYPDMRNASETANRYDPIYSDKWQTIFAKMSQFQILQERLESIPVLLENISSHFPALTPSPRSVKAFAEFAQHYKTEMINRHLPAITKQFERINEIVDKINYVFSNETLLQYLFDDVDNITDDAFRALVGNSLFTVTKKISNNQLNVTTKSRFKVDLNLITNLVETLPVLSDVGHDMRKYTTRYLLDNGGILLNRFQAKKLEALIPEVETVIVGFNEKKPSGCIARDALPLENVTANINKPIPSTAKINTSTSKNNSLPMNDTASAYDLLFCFLLSLSSPNVAMSVADTARTVVVEFQSTTKDSDQQRYQCHALLCRVLLTTPRDDDDGGCTIDRDRAVQMARSLVQLFSPVLDRCRERFELVIERKLLELVNWYTSERLPTYAKLVTLAEQIRDSYEKATEHVQSDGHHIGHQLTQLGYLLQNLTAYEESKITFEKLATLVVKIFTPWVIQNLYEDMSQLKQKLAELDTTIATLEEAISRFINQSAVAATDAVNIPEYLQSPPGYEPFPPDPEEIERGRGAVEVVAKYFLFGNSTFEQFQRTLKLSKVLRKSLRPITPMMLEGVENIATVMTDFEKISRTFLQKVETGPTFLQRNFLIICVSFAELSQEVITQQYTFNLLQALADFGGISGLWFGFSMVAVIEFVDICILKLIEVAFRKFLPMGRKVLVHLKTPSESGS